MNRRYTLLSLALGVMVLSGCAAYEHRLAEPAEFSGPIDREGIAFVVEPLEYRAAEERGRLALRIFNRSGESITLLGERSYLVDPTGETRAMLGGTIAPGSYITMILPPQVESTGPRFGVGVGVGVGAGRVGVGGHHDPWRHHPTAARGVAPLWRWTTGEVLLHLVYERDGERVMHDLRFDRVKVN